jgi:hypothetical protein
MNLLASCCGALWDQGFRPRALVFLQGGPAPIQGEETEKYSTITTDLALQRSGTYDKLISGRSMDRPVNDSPSYGGH